MQPPGAHRREKGAQTKVCATGGIMSSTTQKHLLGQWLELGGIAAVALGAALSVRHLAIGILFVAGAAAFFLGRNLRAA